MKNNIIKARNFLAIALSVVLCLPTSTVVFAADVEPVYGVEDMTAVLEKINAEYGTNMHILSDSELAELGLPVTESQPLTASELKEFEEQMRYAAEVRIPQFERKTQEALTIMESLDIDSDVAASSLDEESIPEIADQNPVMAYKAIDYAIAIAQAYITTDDYGNRVWGTIVNAYCGYDADDPVYFIAPAPTAKHIDARRSIYWTGEGQYFQNSHGQMVFLAKGTQYASMYVGNY